MLREISWRELEQQALMVLGVAGLFTGGFALAASQPYAVYYPLFLMGLIASVIPAFALPNIRRRYQEMELRKMSALDVS